MPKIYFNGLAIQFIDNIENIPENVMRIAVANISDIRKTVEKLHNDGFDCDICLYGYNPNDMYANFLHMYKYIEAAGGVVKNEKDEYLLIKRFGIWDLPKGKVENGEETLEAAIREVCEETGLVNVAIINNLPNTYHIYYQNRRWFLKKTYWYFMETKDDISLVPQVKEAITEAVWMKRSDAYTALSNSYKSLFDALGYLFE